MDEKERTVREVRASVVQKEQVLRELQESAARKDEAARELYARLSQIQSSHGWKALKRYYRLRDWVLPEGSWRRTALKFVWHQLTPHFAPLTDDYCLAVPFGYSVCKWQPSPHLAVICHIFYAEMCDDFRRYFLNIPFPADLFITTDSCEKKSAIENVFSGWSKGNVDIRIVPNRGRDIAPKLIACSDVYDNYEFVLHVHTKRSPHHGPLAGWRSYLLETLLGSEEIVGSIFESFRIDPGLGMVAPQHFEMIRPSIGWGWNFKAARSLARRMGVMISLDERIDFPSGSMFWARSAALKPLLDCGLSLNEFPTETNQLDRTMAHVIERLYFFSCERAGYRWIKIVSPANVETPYIHRIEIVSSQNDLSTFIKNYRQCRAPSSRVVTNGDLLNKGTE